MTLARAVILGTLQAFMIALLIALLITGIDLVPALRSGIPGEEDRPRLVGAVLIFGAPLVAGFNVARLRPEQSWTGAAISGMALALFATVCLMTIDTLRSAAWKWAASYGLGMLACGLVGAALRSWWRSRVAAHERMRREKSS